MAKRTPLSTIKKYRWQELGLLIIPFIVFLIAMTQLLLARSVRAGVIPTSSLSSKNLPTIQGLIPVLGIIVFLFLINFLLSFTFPSADQVLLPLVGLLSGIGVLMALRIGPNLVPASPSLGTRQLIWVVVGLVTFLITLFALRRIEWLKNT
ncbi:MAG TPA: FtsW/RodA/SpoVE family cell cycle protein, partial [Ktedonobacteraceae bacterium]|nr:FtsW/RodA/SpoVE family cell cycle protein [Ktedonobacteraceae bacterium]